MEFEIALIIRDKTRLEQLIERFNSKGQAKFYIERQGGDFASLENEHNVFYDSLKKTEKRLKGIIKYKVVARDFISTYIFSETDLIIVIGQDGLVANVAKYVNQQPIIAVNPDPSRYDGILLPHNPDNFKRAVVSVLQNEFSSQRVTLAEAVLSDGQRLLAFNDFYIGASSHVSSRYKLTHGDKSENQSSSGILVATGAGSTGWLSSILNMARNVNKYFGARFKGGQLKMKWDDKRLFFAVREPFSSVSSRTEIGFGVINKGQKLTIESHMAENGVIFSDGIEADHLKFNTGSRVEIGIATEMARIVME